ncbi:MAG TPA: thioredoxin family protein [Lacunisphaera sp.]
MKLLPALLAALALSATALAAPKGAEPAHIAMGQTIVLADHLVPGKTTIVDFTSKYCPPCQFYNEPLAKLHAQRADIAVVKVDINRPDVKRIDWQSPVAQQFKLQSIPHFKVYGPDGKLIAEDQPGVASPARALVHKFIEELK